MGQYELEDVREARKARDLVQNDLDLAVGRSRASGDSWEAIAKELGVSRQAAWERYGRKVEE